MSDQLKRAFLACTRGDIAMLQKYVPSAVKVDEYIFQWMVASISCRHVAMLHIAAGCGQDECLSYLISQGANVNIPDLMVPF